MKVLKLKKSQRNQQPKLDAILIRRTRQTCNNACNTGKLFLVCNFVSL